MRGYFVEDISGLQEFPVAERYGSLPIGIVEGDLTMTTERGKEYVYKQFTKRVWKLTFRVSLFDLAFFRTLHETVGGKLVPFYFMEDTADSSGSAVLVRKEPDFEPRELDQPASIDEQDIEMYDYTLILTEEPEGAEVQA